MRKPNHTSGSCEEVLRDLLLAAAAPDNFDAFLRRIIETLGRHNALGRGAGLAVVLRPGKKAPLFTVAVNFTKEERRRLSEIRRPVRWPKDILAAGIKGDAAKGFLLARLPAPASRACAGRLLAMAAKTINGRLAREGREEQLTRERDIADAITHLEELYLAFPAISLEEISRTVLDEARRLTGSRFGFAGYIDPATGWLQVPALTDEARKNCRAKKYDVVFKEFTGLWGWVIRKKKPLLTNSAASDPRAGGIPGGRIKIKKFAAAPAVSGKKLIGILALANPPRDYPPAALDAIKKLARVYALMLCHTLAEEALKRSEERYRLIVETTNEGFGAVDTRARITGFNPRLEEMFGYAGGEMLGLNILQDLLLPEDRPGMLRQLQNRRSRKSAVYEQRFRRKDGAIFWANVSGTPVTDKEGTVTGSFAMMSDITGRKLAEAGLREQATLLKAQQEASPDAILVVGKDGGIRSFNRHFTEMWGLPSKIMDTGSDEAALRAVRDKLTDPKAFFKRVQYLYWHPDEESRDEISLKDGRILDRYSTAVVGSGGEYYGRIWHFRDITGRRRLENIIKENEEILSKIFDTTTDAIFLKDTGGRFLKVNRACADLFNIKPADMIGETDARIFSAGLAAENLKDDAEVMLQGRTLFFNKERSFPSGKCYMSVAKTPLRGVDGKITGVLGVGRDLTGIRKMETELAVARAADALSRVARPMAHDFNNALAAINGYATLIDEDLPASSPIKTEISRIIEAVRRATELTSKLQDFARNPKIEDGEAAQFNRNRRSDGC